MAGKKPEEKKASDPDDTLMPIEANMSIKSLRLDIELLRFINMSQQPVRMKTIKGAKQFSLLSESTLRTHLKRLVRCRCLDETVAFRGSYTVSEGQFDDFCESFVRYYLRRLLGEELFDTVMTRLHLRQ